MNDLEWATDFAPEEPPRTRRPSGAAVAVTSGLLALSAVIVAAVGRAVEQTEGGTALGPANGPSAPSAPVPSASAPPRAAPLPESCDELYGAEMLGTLAAADLHLNATWTGVRQLAPASADAQLIALLPGAERLNCYWLDSSGGTEVAVLTAVTHLEEADLAAAVARAEELGLARTEHDGGLRFSHQARTEEGELHGEAHFFRDELWIGTRWYGYGPYGYTAHMAQQLFP